MTPIAGDERVGGRISYIDRGIATRRAFCSDTECVWSRWAEREMTNDNSEHRPSTLALCRPIAI